MFMKIILGSCYCILSQYLFTGAIPELPGRIIGIFVSLLFFLSDGKCLLQDSEKLKAKVGEEKRRYFYMLIWKLLVVSAFPNYDINSPSYSLAMVNVYLLLMIYALNSEKCLSGQKVIHVLDPLPGKCQTDIQQSADRLLNKSSKLDFLFYCVLLRDIFPVDVQGFLFQIKQK